MCAQVHTRVVSSQSSVCISETAMCAHKCTLVLCLLSPVCMYISETAMCAHKWHTRVVSSQSSVYMH